MQPKSTTRPSPEEKRRHTEYMRGWRERRSPEQRAREVARVSEWRRQRKARDPEFKKRLLRRSHACRTSEQHCASEAVRLAVRSGELVKPTTCESCGQSEPYRIEAAHYDYARRLDVRWLCVLCHRRWDRDLPKGGYVPPEPMVKGEKVT